jgi:2-dehydropantoate 2-reductase
MGAITCLLRGNVGEIEAVPRGADLALQMLAETSAVAAAAGYPPRAEFSARMQATFTAAGSPLAASMYRDLQSNRDVEVDQILGDLIERARQFGQPAPLLAAACANLRIYQRRRRATAPA